MGRLCIEWSLRVALVSAALERLVETVCGMTLILCCLSHVTSASLLYTVLWHCCSQWTSLAMLTCSSLLARLHASYHFVCLTAVHACVILCMSRGCKNKPDPFPGWALYTDVNSWEISFPSQSANPRDRSRLNLDRVLTSYGAFTKSRPH